MKKIPTLFTRIIVNHEITGILPVVTEGCEWVLAGEGVATRKLDGTACMVKDGKLYARYDYKTKSRKQGNKLPQGAIACQEEPDKITGHFPHWVPVETNPKYYKWHIKAFEKQPNLPNGTYELVGEHFRNDAENVGKGDILLRHGNFVLNDVPRTFLGIKEYLRVHNIEGIVFHRENGDMCKIKRTDFHFMWNNSYNSR